MNELDTNKECMDFVFVRKNVEYLIASLCRVELNSKTVGFPCYGKGHVQKKYILGLSTDFEKMIFRFVRFVVSFD